MQIDGAANNNGGVAGFELPGCQPGYPCILFNMYLFHL